MRNGGVMVRLSDKGKENLLRVMELARGNREYRAMMREFQALDPELQRLMEAMPSREQEIVGAYLAVVAQAGRCMVDLACENMRFPE